MASVREFLDSLGAQDISRLPIRCLEVSRGNDIPRLSQFLARAHESLPNGAPERVIYMRTVALLCYATDRLSQVPPESPEAWEPPP